MNNTKREHILWVEKYRPKTVKECILPKALKEKFQGIVDKGELPNLTLNGTPGTGKTTIAEVLAHELNADFLKINASEEGNIDTLRVKIKQYASTVSLTGGRKIILLDEADHMNANSLQPALRAAIEEYSKNTGFILTCNTKNRILGALHSRCPVVDFVFPKNEKQQLALDLFNRLKFILKTEKIVCENDKILAELITKFFPDMRRIIGELQTYSSSGKIDIGVLAQIGDIKIAELMGYLKNKDFSKVRTWCVQNSDNDAARIFRVVYDNLIQYIQPKSIPESILILARYMYQGAFVADAEINLAACLIELMVECEFK